MVCQRDVCHSAGDAQAAGAGREGKGRATPVLERGEEHLYVDQVALLRSRRHSVFKKVALAGFCTA